MKWLWGQFLFVQLCSDVIRHSVVLKKKGIRGLSNTHPNYNPDSKMPGCCVNSVLWFAYPAWHNNESCKQKSALKQKTVYSDTEGSDGNEVGRGRGWKKTLFSELKVDLKTVECTIFDQYVALRSKGRFFSVLPCQTYTFTDCNVLRSEHVYRKSWAKFYYKMIIKHDMYIHLYLSKTHIKC